MLAHWPGYFAQFDDMLPLLLVPDVSAALERFDIATSDHPNGILVTATPKQYQDAVRWDRVELLLDPTTFRATAHRVVKGRNESVHVFENVQVNEADDSIPRLLEAVF
jgi:hypothetical protein